MIRIKSITQIFLTLTLGLWVVGCTPLHISRTVGFSGLPPLGDVKKITVVDKMEEVTKPYQVVGTATIYRTGTMVTKGACLNRIKNLAAQMGADGIIGLHTTGFSWTGLAVKWLSPEETPQPVKVPFVVALLPVTINPEMPGNHDRLAMLSLARFAYNLEKKGYYVIRCSDQVWAVTNFTGGIEAAKKLDSTSRQRVGGGAAQLLIQLAVIGGHTENNVIIAGSAVGDVRMLVLDKQQGEIVYDLLGKGRYYSVGIGNPVDLAINLISGAKLEEAVLTATDSATAKLPDVLQPITP